MLEFHLLYYISPMSFRFVLGRYILSFWCLGPFVRNFVLFDRSAKLTNQLECIVGALAK